jgi:ComEC/Rec2-related protein
MRLGASACLGIILGLWWPALPIEWEQLHGCCLVGAVALRLLLGQSPQQISYPMRHFPGFLCWMSLTAGLASIQRPAPQNSYGMQGNNQAKNYSAESIAPGSITVFSSGAGLGSDLLLVQIFRQDGPARFRAVVHRRLVNSAAEGSWMAHPAHSEILLSLPISQETTDGHDHGLPRVGDHLLTEAAHRQPVKGPKHPGQADLRDYYQSQGIYHEINLSRIGSYRLIHRDSGSADDLPMRNQSYKVSFGIWQSYWSQRMDLCIKDSVGRALSKALLLGWRVDLSRELQDGFRNSGTVHLLAVSGLHVLFIYQILNGIMRVLYLFTAAIRGRSGRWHEPPKWIIFIVLSSLILAYALLTGGAPSAMRAAMVVVWMNWTRIISGNRHASAALLLTGVLLVILEPMAWKDPGFQLSFGAVGGLLWIYAPLWKMAQMDQSPPGIRYPVSLIGMSLVAQAVTAPLCWYHFGQFPNYFLVANLVLVPLSSPLLITAILWTLTGNVPILGPLITWFGKFLYGITAKSTSLIGSWPAAVSFHWDFRGSDLAFSFALLGTLMMGIHRIATLNKSPARAMRFRHLIVILAIGWIIMIAYRNTRWYLEGKAAQCVAFGIPPRNCLWVQDGYGWLGSGDHKGLTDRRPLQWMRRQCQRPSHPMASVGTDSSCKLLQWKIPITFVAGLEDTFHLAPTRNGPLRLLHLYGNKPYAMTGKVDMIVLGQGARVEWSGTFTPSYLILTGGHTRQYRRFMASLCMQQGVVFCDLSQSTLPDSKLISPCSSPNWSI